MDPRFNEVVERSRAVSRRYR